MTIEHIENDRGLTDFHFAIVYKKLRGDSGPVKYFLRSRSSTTTANLGIATVVSSDSVAAETSQWEHLVGQQLNYNNDVYIVNSVNEDGATVEIMRMFEEDNHTNIPINAATHILEQSIRRAITPSGQ